MMEEKNTHVELSISDLERLNQKFSDLLQQALRSSTDEERDRLIAQAKLLKTQISQGLEDFSRRRDPDKLFLRKEIAREFGYKFVGGFSEEGIAVARTVEPMRNYIYINQKGEKLFDQNYTTASKFVDGFGIVKSFEGAHVINNSGGVATPNFDFINRGGEGLFIVIKGGNSTFYAPYKGPIGKLYRSIKPFSEGVAVAENEAGKQRFIDTNGQEVFGRAFKAASSFSEGLAAVSDENSYYYIDHKGKKIFPQSSLGVGPVRFNKSGISFHFALGFSEGLAAVIMNRDSFLSFLDHENNIRHTNYHFWNVGEHLPYFKEGFCVVNKESNHQVLINHSFEVLLPKTRFCQDFNEGVAWVSDDGNFWYLVNKKGETVIDPLYQRVANFEDGVASVIDDEGFQKYIDKTGKQIFG